jgi:hypothetical protein
LDLRQTSCLSALLALCEAELGEHTRAVSRINAVLDACDEYGLAALQMGNIYLRAARVGLAAKDDALFQRAARSYGVLCKDTGLPGLLSRYDALMQLAHGADTKSSTAFDGLIADSTEKLGGRRVRGELRRQLAASSNARGRVERTLRWLQQRVRAAEGYVYAVSEGAARCVASATGQVPDGATDALVDARLLEARAATGQGGEPLARHSADALAPTGPCIVVIEQRAHGRSTITALIALERRGHDAVRVPPEVVRAIEVELDPNDLLALSHDALLVGHGT